MVMVEVSCVEKATERVEYWGVGVGKGGIRWVRK